MRAFLRRRGRAALRAIVVAWRDLARRDFPAEVRDLPAEVRDLPAEVRDLPAEVRDLPAEVRDIPVEVRDLPAEVRDLPAEMRSRAQLLEALRAQEGCTARLEASVLGPSP